MQNVQGQGRGGASYKNRQPSAKVLPLKLKHTGTHSLLLEDHHEVFSPFQLGDTTICVVKQGSLHKTRLSEGGKKYR